MAFLTWCPLRVRTKRSRIVYGASINRAVPRVHVRRISIACKLESGDKERKQTKAEEITRLLGRDVQEEKAKAAQFIEEVKQEEKGKWAKAFGAVFLALAIFAVEKLNPENPLKLYRIMEERSALVSQIGQGRSTVVEFYAPWCESCKLMAKDVFELDNQYAGAVNWITVNADRAENGLLLEKFGVDGVPQFTFLNEKGQEVATLIGKIPRVVLNEEIDALYRGRPMPHTSGPGTAETLDGGRRTVQ